MGYENLTQRAAAYFLDTYCEHIPMSKIVHDGAPVSVESQKSAYLFIRNIYQQIYDNADLLGMKILPDDSYGRWQMNKEKPGLDVEIRKRIGRIEKIIAALYEVSLKGSFCEGILRISAAETGDMTSLKKLNKFNIPVKKEKEEVIIAIEKDIWEGLHVLACISKENYEQAEYKNTEWVLFTRGVFNRGENYNRSIFVRLSKAPQVLERLLDFLETNEYERIANRECASKISKITLDYVKFYDPKDRKVGANWNVRTSAGIELAYDELKEDGFYLGLRIPYYKKILEHSMEMTASLRTFVIEHTKKCDGCRYCVQTDKTGKRPLAAVKVEDAELCPYYPGFSYKFFEVEESMVERSIELLNFIEKQCRSV